MKRILVPLLLLYLATPPAGALADPIKLPDEDLQAVTGGLLDLYFVMPITIVNSTNTTLAGTGGDGIASAVGNSNVTVSTNVVLNSIDVLLAPISSNPAASGGDASLAQMPVWVPWKQELRPLGIVGGMLAAFLQ
jgi:short subunit fatty acids transporter